MSKAQPNAAHTALAELEGAGLLRGVITQNVDGLHHAAGSRRVIELHGSLAAVCCLGCEERVSRDSHQERLLSENPGWLDGIGERKAESAPDGDAEIPDRSIESFSVPDCHACGGVLKPDVVFFGENVPKSRVDAAWALFDEGDVLLVVGSTLTVFSGRRFVYRATKRGVPIGVVNLGPTRADEFAAAKVEGRLGLVMPRLVQQLIAVAAHA